MNKPLRLLAASYHNGEGLQVETIEETKVRQVIKDLSALYSQRGWNSITYNGVISAPTKRAVIEIGSTNGVKL